MRILVQNTQKPEQKQRLTLYHLHVQKLLENMNVLLDLYTATEQDVLKASLKSNKNVDMTFDAITYRVTDI